MTSLNRNLFPFAAGLALLALSPAALSAAEPAGGEQSIFDLPARWDLSIYTLFVFGLLFFILARFAWPHIMAGMHAREAGMLQARDEAIAAKREAEAIRAELPPRLAQAHDEVKKMIEDARADGERMRLAEREAGQKEAAAERERAKREIEAAKEQALTEIYQRSVRLASLMASKAIRRDLTVSDQGRLLEESLTELAGQVRPN